MQLICFTVRLLFAVFQLATTLILAAGFVVLVVPGILVRHLLEQPVLKPALPNGVALSPTLTTESAF